MVSYKKISDRLPKLTHPSALGLIDLKTAARWERSGRCGRPPSISRRCRWILRGVRLREGTRLHLQVVRVPSGWRTCRRWLEEFHPFLTADRLGGACAAVSSPADPVNGP